ncbi:hypothetical protein D9M69_494510 [compost metagenome]
MLPRPLYLLHTGVKVAGQLADLLHHLRRAMLDVGHHLAHLPRGGRCACGEPANLVGHHCKPATVLPCPRRFYRSVQCQQIGLAGDGLNHQGHPLDIIAAQAQGFDQFTAVAGALAELMHTRNGLDQFRTPDHSALMSLAGGTERLATEGRGGLFGGDHDLGIADDLCRRRELRLQFVRQLPNRKRHTGGRQCVMAGGAGKIASQRADGIGVVGASRLRGRARTQTRQPDNQYGQGQAKVERPIAQCHAT